MLITPALHHVRRLAPAHRTPHVISPHIVWFAPVIVMGSSLLLCHPHLILLVIWLAEKRARLLCRVVHRLS